METKKSASQITETLYRQYLEHLLAGNKKSCITIINELLGRNIDIKDLYTNLFQRSMYEVGHLWESNQISIATEHLATFSTEGLLNLVYPVLFSTPRVGKKAVISCVKNGYHQVGGKMVADIFELKGWDGYFLGANTPSRALVQFIDEQKPRLVGLSISILSNLVHLQHTLKILRTTFPNLDIILGGQAFRYGGMEVLEKFRNVVYIPSLTELENLVIKKNNEG
jgi:methanogenic corrinoid protein MtbC1